MGCVTIEAIQADSILEIPFISVGISAGFPSPAMDFEDVPIDLNKYLIKRPNATFLGRVQGDSMVQLGIHDGDLLIVDRSIPPKSGLVAVCFLDGEFTLKSIQVENEVCWLIPANEKYQPIKVTPDNQFLVWGIVSFVIKSF